MMVLEVSKGKGVIPVLKNGWFCKVCGCVTEHRKVNGKEVCVDCGSALGSSQRPDVKERKKAYSQRPDVKERKKAYSQRPDVKERQKAYMKDWSQRPDVKERQKELRRQCRIAKLEKKLRALKMEASN